MLVKRALSAVTLTFNIKISEIVSTNEKCAIGPLAALEEGGSEEWETSMARPAAGCPARPARHCDRRPHRSAFSSYGVCARFVVYSAATSRPI